MGGQDGGNEVSGGPRTLNAVSQCFDASCLFWFIKSYSWGETSGPCSTSSRSGVDSHQHHYVNPLVWNFHFCGIMNSKEWILQFSYYCWNLNANRGILAAWNVREIAGWADLPWKGVGLSFCLLNALAFAFQMQPVPLTLISPEAFGVASINPTVSLNLWLQNRTSM